MNLKVGMLAIAICNIQDQHGVIHPPRSKWKLSHVEDGYWVLSSVDCTALASGCTLGVTFELYGPMHVLEERIHSESLRNFLQAQAMNSRHN